ncbi:MAG: hypothetical protein OD817_08250 [Gammaproteobacteria bacterium]
MRPNQRALALHARQIFFLREGRVFQRIVTGNVAGFNPGAVQLAAVILGVFIEVFNLARQQRRLMPPQVFGGHGFQFFIPESSGHGGALVSIGCEVAAFFGHGIFGGFAVGEMEMVVNALSR